ncbi:MAG: hypothetical protein H6727_09485 [Myxococcales bacterium]|nr:hypothetical protein [Myxococcales bacterium]
MHLQDALWLYFAVGIVSCGGFWWWSDAPPLQRIAHIGLHVVLWPIMWPLLWDMYRKHYPEESPKLSKIAASTALWGSQSPQAQELQRLLQELEEAFEKAPDLGQLHTTLETSQPIRQGLEALLAQETELGVLLSQERFSLERARVRLEQAQAQQDTGLLEHAQSGLLHIQQLHDLQKKLKTRLDAIAWQLERLITQIALMRFTQADANQAQEALLHLLELVEIWNETSQPPSLLKS